ncbi:MAG TPA: hypothetical protein DIW51_12085 [Rhodospirillaceae bacterium]|nr:hypothetical protein [Magnetovibrio sp.]HBT43984.1 hypothetical protein [Rhodospirillaceae bacterium]HCS70692.1 hypothetical protein [Rhodospirillaceae bacterium]
MSAPRRRRLLVPLIFGLALAGCAGDGMAPPETATPAAAPASTPEAAGPPPLPRIAAQAVLGYSRPDLVAAFGAPAFSRIDKGAEILRFRGQGCVLDVFLYKDAQDAAARVAHFEARDEAGKTTDRQSCVNATPRLRG